MTLNSKHFLLLLMLVSTFFLKAQQHSDKEYQRKPLWIQLIEDPNVNYFEAKKAFDLFWKNKPLPTEEDEVIGEQHGKGKERDSFLEKLFMSKKERQEEESQKYAFEYKKFKHWERLVLPYVQEDGRVLTADERLKLWQDSRQK